MFCLLNDGLESEDVIDDLVLQSKIFLPSNSKMSTLKILG